MEYSISYLLLLKDIILVAAIVATFALTYYQKYKLTAVLAALIIVLLMYKPIKYGPPPTSGFDATESDHEAKFIVEENFDEKMKKENKRSINANQDIENEITK